MQDKQGNIVDRREMLKVKIINLMDEAHTIRTMEQRSGGKGAMYDELRNHRVQVVRHAARETHLAYGFVRGKHYSTMEAAPKAEPNWARIEAMVQRYGGPTTRSAQGAKAWVAAMRVKDEGKDAGPAVQVPRAEQLATAIQSLA